MVWVAVVMRSAVFKCTLGCGSVVVVVMLVMLVVGEVVLVCIVVTVFLGVVVDMVYLNLT